MNVLNRIRERLRSNNKVSPHHISGNKVNKGFKILHDDNDSSTNNTSTSENVCENKFRFHQVKMKVHSIHPKLISFYDIVTDCDRFREERFKQNYIGRLLNSTVFRITIIIVILLNSVVITIQTDKYLETNFGTMFVILDKVFLTIYIIEILIKWYYDFQTFWRIGWNIFDFAIVVASLFGPSLSFMSGENIFRILRMLRALRSLRSISALRGLQIIVQTVIHSIPDMANIVTLLFICMFIFAVLGVSFFGENCPKYFGSLGKALFSLFICITQDGWIAIRNDLKSCGNDITGAIYLTVFIMIGAFVFANLVVAVVVTNLEWAISEQREMDKKDVKNDQQHNKMSNVLKTTDTSDILPLIAHNQEPILNPIVSPSVRSMEVYFLILTQIEENLLEFKSIREKLSEILNEVKALSQFEDETTSLSDIGSIKVVSSSTSRSKLVPKLSPMLSNLANTRRKQSIFKGDAISDLITMNRRHTIDSGSANRIGSLINQLHTNQLLVRKISPVHQASQLTKE